MKPARFRYLSTRDVEEAVELLEEYGDEARILAGGQSLIPLMNMRLARPEVLIDIGRIEELRGIEVTNGDLAIGAVTSQLEARRSADLARGQPIVIEALRYVGHIATQSRGTVGGSIAHADPSAELPAVLTALGGKVTAVGPDGERTIHSAELFRGYFTTALARSEILTRVHIPLATPMTRYGFYEVARRRGDFALVGAVSSATFYDDVTVDHLRLVLFGVGPQPVELSGITSDLRDAELTGKAIGEVAARARSEVDPPPSADASPGYRRELVACAVAQVLWQVRRPSRGVK